MKKLIVFIALAAFGQGYVFNPFTNNLDKVGSSGGTGSAPYSASVAAQTTLTVTAATHGQGTTQALLVSCLDGAGSPWDGAACDYTISSAGEVVFTWAPAFTGYIVIGGGGTGASGLLSGALADIPATCTVGASLYQATDEPITTQIYACTATNTWTRASYTQGTTAPVTCSVGQLFFDTDATAGENLFGCTATNTWTAQAGGGGGGATSLSGLTDLQVSRTSSAVLTVAAGNARVGSATSVFSAATGTLSGTSASGTVYAYVSSAGVLTLGHNAAWTLTCSGCTTATSISAFPAGSIPIATWTVTSTTWNVGGGTDFRAINSVDRPITSTTLTVATTAAGVSIESMGNTFPVNAQTGTTYAITSGDCGSLITFSNASAIAVSLPASPLANGCQVATKTIGTGDVTITPISGTISGAAAITVSLGEFAVITSDGANYEVETNRLVAGTGIALTKSRTSVSVAATGGGSGDVVGPASAVDSNLAAFDTATGKLIKDSGLPSASTGTGNIVRATSPTLVTPALGTPSALVLTNATGLPISGGGTGGTTAATARGALGIVNVLSYTAGGGTTVADSTTYYHTWNNQAYQTTENSVSKVSMPVAGTITSLVLMVSQNGATATSENVTVTLRINGSDTAITGTMAWDASSSNVNTGTFTGSVAVAAGDILSIKMVTPAWVTNPSNVRSIANIVLKMDQ